MIATLMSRENFHQCLAAINVLCSVFMIGVHTNWVSAVIPKLQSGKDGLKADNEQISWIVCLSESGRFFGPLITAFVLDRIGRRSTALICSILFFILWLFMIFVRSIELIYCLRIMFGALQGVMDVTGTIYLAENCTPKMRGILISIIPLCHVTAFTAEYILAAYGSYKFVATVNAVIGFAALSTSVFLKETPYYLVMKGSNEAAKRNLQWLRGRATFDKDLRFEMDKIQQNMQLEIQKKRSLTSLFGSPENYKPLRIATTFSFLIPALGIKMIFAYSSLIFKSTSLFSVNDIAIVFGVIQFISACVTPFIIERYNRRPLLLITLCILGLCHISTFIIFKLKISDEYFAWLILATITLFSVIYTLTFSVMVTIRTELLPTSVRAIGGSLNIMMSSIAATTCLRLFLPITDAFGMGYNFLLFFAATFLQFILVLIIIPETRGKSLVDIQMSFVSNKQRINV